MAHIWNGGNQLDGISCHLRLAELGHRFLRELAVDFRVLVGHPQRSFAQHGPGGIKADLLSYPRGSGVSQAVRCESLHLLIISVGSLDRRQNSLPVRAGRIGVAGLFPGVGFSITPTRVTLPLSGLSRGLGLLSHLLHRFLRGEAREVDPAAEKRLKDLLRLGSDVDFSSVAVVTGLVVGGLVDPHLPARINVHGSYLDQLATPHCCVVLQFDHCGHRWRAVGEHAIHEGNVHCLDLLCLAGVTSPHLESINGLQRMVGTRREKHLAGTPLEASPDQLDVLVHDLAGESALTILGFQRDQI